MSTADLDLFGPPGAEAADYPYPRFAQVLRGFDPEQVREYVLQLTERIEALEKEVELARAERDAARKRYALAREDAYGQLASRMAELLKVADRHAERMRREAEEEVGRRLAEARQLSQQIVREAEGQAEHLRREAEEVLRRARADRDRLLGGLAATRDAALAELRATRDHMASVIKQLEAAMAVAESVAPTAEAEEGEDPQVDDLLGRAEGFEIMLPELLGGSEPPVAEVIQPASGGEPVADVVEPAPRTQPMAEVVEPSGASQAPEGALPAGAQPVAEVVEPAPEPVAQVVEEGEPVAEVVEVEEEANPDH